MVLHLQFRLSREGEFDSSETEAEAEVKSMSYFFSVPRNMAAVTTAV